MIISHTARGIAAGDLNESFIGNPLAIEIDGQAHFVRMDGIQERDAATIRLFVGVPVGPDGETWLDLPRTHVVYSDPSNNRE